MVRGGRAPRDASHGDVPKLPLAELGGWDDKSGDGTVHGTFTALTQDPEGPRVPPMCSAHAGPSLVLHRTLLALSRAPSGCQQAVWHTPGSPNLCVPFQAALCPAATCC